MKKIIFCTFFLACISAFAYRSNPCKPKVHTAVNIKKQTQTHSPTPIADMVMLPHLGL